MRTRSRPGITLINLLVVLAILGFLLALLLPAIQKVRWASSRVQSQLNLKQLGIACHNYHDSYNKFPPGNDAKGFSAAARLLPYIEQQAVYNMIDFKKSIDDKANANARRTQVITFLSLLDPLQSVTPKYGATNYLFNAGSKAALKDNDGIFYQDSEVNFAADIPDGMSNTLMIGETLKGDGQNRAVTVSRQYVALAGKNALKNLKDDSGVKEWKANKNIAGDRCASWMAGRFLQGTFTGTRDPNDLKPDVSADDGQGGLSALRGLDVGTNIALCDGSVRFLSNKVDPKLMKLLTGRNDGEVLPDY